MRHAALFFLSPFFLFLSQCSHVSRVEYSNMSPLHFKHSPEEVTQICTKEKQDLLSGIEKIEAVAAKEADFENTVHALDLVFTDLTNHTDSVLFLKYVSTDTKVREAAGKCETELEQLMVDVFAREALFAALKTGSEKAKDLDTPSQMLANEFLTKFRRNGLELPKEKRKVFLDKKKELVALEADFGKELVEWKETVTATLEELKGVPEAFIDGLKRDGSKYVLTLSYPHYFTVMDNAVDPGLRYRMLLKFFQRGGEKNRKRLEKAIQLRHEMARMLGYPSHAHFVTDKQMAANPQEVTKFLDELEKRLKPLGKKNLEELLVLKKSTGAKGSTITAEDWRYYDNQLLKTKYKVDNEKIREYFPFEKVVAGMFEIYQTILGVTFKEDKGAEAWEGSVKRYSVYDGSGQVVAQFYMDLFPRDGKYNHAAAFTLLKGFEPKTGGYQVPASAIVANFNAPSVDRPSLLDHKEVETLFHEFGHIMHQVLTKARYGTLSGTAVKRDFVEAPSQMLENWVWEKDSLKKLSGHYKTGNALPDEDIAKLIAAKNVDNGIKYLRQVSFARIDLDYHSHAKVNTTDVYKKYAKNTMLIPIPEGAMPEASFGHLMGGYDAGYYGYLWSEVYAADMFTRFASGGLLNKQIGADYRKWILEPGGQIAPATLIEGFLGRKPTLDAFFKELGI